MTKWPKLLIILSFRQVVNRPRKTWVYWTNSCWCSHFYLIQSNTLKSNVLVNFFFLRGLRFLDLLVHDGQVEPCSRTFWGCTSGGVYVPCIYTHVRWVTAGDSGLCCCACMTSLEPPCVLMLQKVLRVKSFLFGCCFCFFALQNDDFWSWS